MRSSTSLTVWLCMNVVSAPWSHSGWKGPATMTWSSTDSTWRDSNSLLHTSSLTCPETEKKKIGGGRREGRSTERWFHPRVSRSLFTTDIYHRHRFVLLHSLHLRRVWTCGSTCYSCERKNHPATFVSLSPPLCWELHIGKVCEWDQ